jgi:OmpA-OmpF porin, OOP family
MLTVFWKRLLTAHRARTAGLAGLLALGLSIQASAMGSDVEGAADHPVVSRFAGSQMVGYQQLEFDAGQFFVPKSASGFDPAKEIDLDKPVVVEGKVTRLIYVAPAGKTPIEVHRNFEQALRAAGMKTVTSVDGRNAWWTISQHWRANFSNARFQPPFARDISPFDRRGFYFYGTLSRDDVEVSVSVLTGPVSLLARDHYQTDENTAQAAIAIQIVEPGASATN